MAKSSRMHKSNMFLLHENKYKKLLLTFDWQNVTMFLLTIHILYFGMLLVMNNWAQVGINIML